MLDEKKVKALIRLIEHNRINIDDIKDADYKTEVENRLQQ